MTVFGLAPLFALTAALYASVGFGGGSTYTALLILFGTPLALVPAISLACNIIVVSGGTLRFARARELPWAKSLPLVGIAAPLAFLGGLTPVKEGVLVYLLGGSLLVSALLLLAQPQAAKPRTLPRWVLYPVAGALGLLAGVVGIGGGIFLAPILHLIRWAEAKQVAATASLFILVNSLFGLAGQLVKGQGSALAADRCGALAAVNRGVDRRHHWHACRDPAGQSSAAAAADGAAGRVCRGQVADGVVVKSSPQAGRWREATEGAGVLKQCCSRTPAPSVSASRCHLPACGEELFAYASSNSSDITGPLS